MVTNWHSSRKAAKRRRNKLFKALEGAGAQGLDSIYIHKTLFAGKYKTQINQWLRSMQDSGQLVVDEDVTPRVFTLKVNKSVTGMVQQFISKTWVRPKPCVTELRVSAESS